MALCPACRRAASAACSKAADWKPHQSRSGLNHHRAEEPAPFDADVQAICERSQQAPPLHAHGVQVVSTDAKTGRQANARAQPTRPRKPGLVERVALEDSRHGTQALIANVEVATGQVRTPSVGPTRTEEDVVSHVERTIAGDPAAAWMFIVDRLNTHQSESLVRFVANQCGVDGELGVKGKAGIFASMPTRAAFVQDPTPRLRLVYTPKQTSWLHQGEIWFGILVRRLLKRGRFTSVTQLRQRILAFSDYFNKTMAKPCKWTYAGRPLAA